MTITLEFPRVQIATELGDIILELYQNKAPITVNNFLSYVTKNAYQNSHFYRIVTPVNQPKNPVPISVIQGGLGMEAQPLKQPPISHEPSSQTLLKHLDGTISMSRLEPGTAHSEIFICLGDQPELDFGGKRNADGQGFAAFGQVINGMDVVRAIHQSPANGEWLEPPITIYAISLLGL